MKTKTIRVLLAKPGLDGHDRGIKIIARALRDAGMEVIYAGLRQTPGMIAKAAVEEDADVLGVSILSGAHLQLMPRIIKELRTRGVSDILILAGGIIPEDDVYLLKKAGVKEVFGPGTKIQDIIDFIKDKSAKN